MVAAIRPDSWNLPLFVHVLGAMLLVGSLVVGLATLVASPRAGGAGAVARVAFRTLLLGAIPSYVVMRAGAQWVESREGIESDPAWIGIGYATADLGLPLLVVATILAGFASRRAPGDATPRPVLGRIGAVLAALLLAAYVVAVWAMTTKPG